MPDTKEAVMRPAPGKPARSSELNVIDTYALHRLRVPGGWLYKHQKIFMTNQVPSTIVFVPDKEDPDVR